MDSLRLAIEPDTPKVESCKFRPRFDMAVIVGRENLQPFPRSHSADEAQSFPVLAHKSWRQPRGLCIHHPSARAVLAIHAGLLCPIASFGLAGKVGNRLSRRRGSSRYWECFLDANRLGERGCHAVFHAFRSTPARNASFARVVR